MKPKHQRLAFVLFSLLMIAIATGLILTAFKDNLVFFYSPSDIAEKPPSTDAVIRVGGLVEDGSINKDATAPVRFVITDGSKTLRVAYAGIFPTLFRDGQGVVAEGKLSEDGRFIASQILAKHDENYMPPEVVKALKDSGKWKGTP